MSLRITSEWELLEHGSPEERACFAELGIFYGESSLTEAEDLYAKSVRDRVHLSAYHLAEWFAWNWWRLLWEPYTETPPDDWAMAHRLPTIGGGYIWPNITIISDGEQITLVAQPTKRSPSEPLRYLANNIIVIQAEDFEIVVTRFIEQVQSRMRAQKLSETNLDKIWQEIGAEREDEELAALRQLEALLGMEPDSANQDLLDRLKDDQKILGKDSVREIAATSRGTGKVPTVDDFHALSERYGKTARPRDMVQLTTREKLSPRGQVPGWKRGSEAANALRLQEKLGNKAIPNKRLLELYGLSSDALQKDAQSSYMSFALNASEDSGRVIFRPKMETGRRFDLARLLGDQIITETDGKLFPATQTDTYRQKMQRAFAAEFLCPFEGLKEFLGGDYTAEKQEEAAIYFKVSPWTVDTILRNRGQLDRGKYKFNYNLEALL